MIKDPRIEAAASVMAEVSGEPRAGRFEYTMANAALAAIDKASTITTFTALDSLPDGSVIIDKHGDVSQRRGDWWCGYQTADLPSRQIAKYLPAQLIHRGTK